MEERIQKFLAHAGVASRRQAEALMKEGRVTVNGKAVSTMGARLDPQKDAVKVDGKLIRSEQLCYVLINKPRGTICTLDDPQGRPMVVELVKGLGVRLYPVGRLDYDTSGALLLTNDGELANQLTHPKHNVPRVYLAKVKGIPSEGVIEKLKSGIYIDGRYTRSAEVYLRSKKVKNSYLELTLREGRNKQIKRMCMAVGHPVLRLEREAFGFLKLDGLESGKWRRLTPAEIEKLKSDAAKRLEAAPEKRDSRKKAAPRKTTDSRRRAPRAGRTSTGTRKPLGKKRASGPAPRARKASSSAKKRSPGVRIRKKKA